MPSNQKADNPKAALVNVNPREMARAAIEH